MVRRDIKKALRQTASGYRSDIDGLRAIAVLSVILFHLEIGIFPGGFVGVDIFFVISGYLISSIMFSQIADSRFSVIGFYERRIRRIFPALFVMLIIFSVFALIYLLPNELVTFCKSMLAATVSVSNFYFWQHSGYFDSPTSQPLLHTWSLAVEEQFYILFPLFLTLIRNFLPQRLRSVVVVLFSTSLVASTLTVSQNQRTAFYMPYTRAWELLMGTILSLGMFPRLNSKWLRNLAALLGIGMIAFSVFRYSEDTVFPGPAALLPCIGSALIIGAGEAGSSLVSVVLSWRPFVFTGLISYSLYLWHWPVIVLQKMGLLVGVSAITSHRYAVLVSWRRFDVGVEIGLSLLLAIVSWRFVERPFRSGARIMSRVALFTLAGMVMVVFIGLSSLTVFTGGFRGRFPSDAVEIASGSHDTAENRVRTGSCFLTTDYSFGKYDFDLCLRQEKDKKNYLLLGDSHAAMLYPALASLLRNANVMQANVAACEPLLNPDPGGSTDCGRMSAYIFDTYLPSHPLQGLFIVGRWSEKNLDNLTATIVWANQHQLPVTVFGPVAEYDGALPRLLAYSIAWKQPGLARRHLVASTEFLDVKMQNMAMNTWHVRYISLYRAICGAKGCSEYADAANKIPLMDDTDHLNWFGASMVVRRLLDKGELD